MIIYYYLFISEQLMPNIYNNLNLKKKKSKKI